ncbi:MAG: hypothetical protein JZU63_00160 [Rhodoferax sp.]|nr:hypothetical protein [Rhodoferax sp.]
MLRPHILDAIDLNVVSYRFFRRRSLNNSNPVVAALHLHSLNLSITETVIVRKMQRIAELAVSNSKSIFMVAPYTAPGMPITADDSVNVLPLVTA